MRNVKAILSNSSNSILSIAFYASNEISADSLISSYTSKNETCYLAEIEIPENAVLMAISDRSVLTIDKFRVFIDGYYEKFIEGKEKSVYDKINDTERHSFIDASSLLNEQRHLFIKSDGSLPDIQNDNYRLYTIVYHPWMKTIRALVGEGYSAGYTIAFYTADRIEDVSAASFISGAKRTGNSSYIQYADIPEGTKLILISNNIINEKNFRAFIDCDILPYLSTNDAENKIVEDIEKINEKVDADVVVESGIPVVWKNAIFDNSGNIKLDDNYRISNAIELEARNKIVVKGIANNSTFPLFKASSKDLVEGETSFTILGTGISGNTREYTNTSNEMMYIVMCWRNPNGVPTYKISYKGINAPTYEEFNEVKDTVKRAYLSMDAL